MIEVLQPVWGWDWPPDGLFVWLLVGLAAVAAGLLTSVVLAAMWTAGRRLWRARR